MKNFYVYALEQPIDFDAGALSLKELTEKATDEYNDFLKNEWHNLLKMQAYGFHLAATQSYWEGDIGNCGFIPIVPDGDCSFVYGFYWKQGNNGCTFFVSPVPMVHLSEHLIINKKQLF